MTIKIRRDDSSVSAHLPTVTIAIPTYNRRKTIFRCLSNLTENGVPDNVHILVIDNNSEDGTFEAIQEFSNDNISILKNNQNIGFAGNTVELIKQCNTEYMIWNSDEDDILVDNLHYLSQFLKDKNPTFVAPQYYQNIKGEEFLYRGRMVSSTIQHKDIWSFTHLPGLIFKINEAKEILLNDQQWKNTFQVAFNIYPQIMIIACLIAKGNGYWWNMAINQEAETLEETHETINGRKYYNLSARWEQYKSFSNFFDFLYRSSQNKDDRKTYKKYNESHNMWFISVIRSSIDMEIPDQLPNFDNALKLNFFTDMNKLKKIFCSFCLGYKFIFNRIKFKNDRMKL